MPQQPQKALFIVYQPDGTTENLPVLFNPTELSFSKAAQIAEIAIPGLDAPLQQFVRGQAEKMTVELFFDTTDEGMDANATSVTTLTDKFYALVKIHKESHAPPVCEFTWNPDSFPGISLPSDCGSQQRHSFKCLVESVGQKFTLFSPTGIPLRATLSVTLREYRPLDEQLTELNLQSADHTKAYVVQRGDTLSGISSKVYGAPSRWRRLADNNSITDPRRLAPGTVLEVAPIG